MKHIKTPLVKICSFIFMVFIFLTFVNSAYHKGKPSRRKFRKLEGGHEVLIKKELPPEVNYLKQIAGDRRLKKWVDQWKKWSPGLDTNTMENLGESYIMEDEIDLNEYKKMRQGPNGQFYMGSPGGKYKLNPYWGRLYYKKTGGDWQPYYDEGCGALVYESSKKMAIMVLRCSLIEGIDDAFWIDKNRFVLMGYEAVTRQMKTECETVESCVAPAVWIVDMSKKTMTQYHGDILKREKCDVHKYIKTKYPKLF